MPSDASETGAIKLRSLLDYFQDTASLAVEDIEGTTSQLIARGYSWVLTKYEIELFGELPAIDETFTITTYHDPEHGFNTLRVLKTGFAFAKTSWLLLDLAARRPVKPKAHLPEITSHNVEAIPPEFREIPKAGELDVIAEDVHKVAFHDLDMNAHVNNAVYFQLVYDSAHSIYPRHKLLSVSADFRKGAKIDESITITTFRTLQPFVLVHAISRKDDAKPLAAFLTQWSENNE